jgi:hypothetical protein
MTMEANSSEIIDNALELEKLGMIFTSKPIIVGGLAMEYYGLRQRGSDVDFIISNDDYQTLAQLYPKNKKDVWADLGISVHGFEMFRSIWRFDYDFYSVNALEYDRYKIVSFEKLFLMKVLAMNAGEKHKRDVALILEQYLKKYENPEYKRNMDDNIQKYLSVPGGIIYNDEY